tara:strand:+ start:7981 stop:8271 length:291 start_codon:yes stop_codon:yes gene_type:complete
MIIEENLNTYFADLGQDVDFNGTIKKGIFNMPDEILAGDMMISTDYVLQVITKDFEDVSLGDKLIIHVNGKREKYEVRSKRMEDDGKLSLISLSKT